jgi:hypothetical protein
MRVASLLIAILLGAQALPGATLEKLTLDEMIGKSTSIVRGKVIASRSISRGPVIYTLSDVQILERWKGPERASVEVAIPGGSRAGYTQEFSGAPGLSGGSEYVLFLWTGKSGVNHVIGLSQGVFTVSADENGNAVVHRPASGEVMLNPKTGQPMRDNALTLGLGVLRDRVDQTLGGVRR